MHTRRRKPPIAFDDPRDFSGYDREEDLPSLRELVERYSVGPAFPCHPSLKAMLVCQAGVPLEVFEQLCPQEGCGRAWQLQRRGTTVRVRSIAALHDPGHEQTRPVDGWVLLLEDTP